MDEWRQHFLDSSPMFEPLRGVAGALAGLYRWPTLDEYNALLNPSPRTASGAALHFVPQAGRPTHMEDKYESRIYLKGEVQTRSENWHDLFNAMAWLAFPHTKTALNARHFEAISQSAADANRGKIQDALTLFDESGVVVLYSDDELARLLREFQWHELFWARRQAANERMKFVIFGHSLFEKALKPYIGFTGKGLLVKVTRGFFSLETEMQLKVIDDLVTDRISADKKNLSLDLSPVPLLGVPGWWADNDDALFYANAHYFRPAHTRGKRS